MKSVKFLFIHYHYPPIKNSGIYRNYYLSSAITDVTGSSCLITTDNRKYLPNEVLPPHRNIEKSEAFTCDYRSVISWLKGKREGSGAQFSEKGKSSFLVSWAIKIQRSFPFNLLFAEGAFFYIISGYLTGLRLIKEKKINVVFSSFMPYADHVIAYLLKKKYPEIKWIADFRDLHVEPIYKNTIWVPFQYWVEKKILSKANLITCVSDGISKRMQNLHPNVMTLTKGVAIRTPKRKYDKFTIAYSGSLFLNFRDPGSLFDRISELLESKAIDPTNFQFIYAGKDGSKMNEWVKNAGIEAVYVNKGVVSHQEAKEIQDRSHINLLLTSTSVAHQGLLTGKFFEYIEAGNPIICIINGDVLDIEIKTMFDRFNLGYIFLKSNDVKWQKKVILDWYNEWLNTGNVSFEMKSDLIQQELGWEVQVQKILKVLQ